ncbi:hypothetical protein ACFQ3B_02045 [Stackebrandtia endophytica]|uniref:hypothetical protein n=1 Tax=Stackebrandtia endophytica TaxID=1496996 RepID=UPI001150A509|nr:hypothetical protein [Stackebrandtia endophytica]
MADSDGVVKCIRGDGLIDRIAQAGLHGRNSRACAMANVDTAVIECPSILTITGKSTRLIACAPLELQLRPRAPPPVTPSLTVKFL